MAVTGTGYAYASSTNVYIPTNNINVEVTANLVVNYSRDIKEFQVNKYSKLIPVAKSQGYYVRISVGQNARLQYPDLRDWLWNPGQDRPRGNWNQLGFQNFPFMTVRRNYGTTLDFKTIDLASFQLQPMHVAMCAQQAMTARTQIVLGVMNDPANWYSTHVSTATPLGGGLWSAGDSSHHFIQDSLYKAAIQCQLDTQGVVKPANLSLVLNPNTARAMASSQELRNYISNQLDAIKFLQGVAPTPQDMYNLPKQLFGFPLYIEDAVVNRGRPTPNDDFTNNSFLMPDGNAVLLARPGELIGSEGGTDYSTVQIFAYEEMSAESFTDTENRRITLGVTEDIDARVVAPAAGYLITGCI